MQFAQFNAFVPITVPMGRAWMECWIGRDWARFVDATRARTIETTDRTTQKKSRRIVASVDAERTRRRRCDSIERLRRAGTVGDGGVAAIAIDDAWSMVFACFGARERGGSAEEDSVEVRWRTGTEVGGAGGGAGRAGRAGREGDAGGTRRRGKRSRRNRGGRVVEDDACVGDARDEDVGDVSDASESEGSGREPDMGLDRATYNFNALNGVATNPALLFWLKRRQMWVNPGRSRGRAKKVASDKKKCIPRHASYDSFLGVARSHSGPFKTAIPLAEMVEFLNDCWDEGEGL